MFDSLTLSESRVVCQYNVNKALQIADQLALDVFLWPVDPQFVAVR
jgi:hypothetical protein